MILCVFCVLALTITPAFAYLDPGSGGVLLQFLLGGVAGLLAVVKIYWQSLKTTFSRFFRKKAS